MRIFVYEWTCCVPSPPPSLAREGWAMLGAVLVDLGQVPNVETVTLLHDSFAQEPPGEIHRSYGGDDLDQFASLAGGVDATLVIAPETHGELSRRVRAVEKIGGRLLGPNSTAIALAGDKERLGQCWRCHGVPTPSTALWKDNEAPPRFPAVLKPRDGAGSVATFLIRQEQDWTAALQQARAEGGTNQCIVQDFVAGQPASVALLIGPAATVALPPATQQLSGDGRFRYEGGLLPLPPQLAQRAVLLAKRAVAVVQGLRGYVGVDLILGEADDGSEDYAIEINPRLTTSYIGLRRLAQTNLAGAMLDVHDGRPPEIRWHTGTVAFRPAGEAQFQRYDIGQ